MDMERNMFYGASPDLFSKAKQLRENMTFEEEILWERLRKNQFGFRFRSQHPISIFIADFYCHPLKLVIEIDGKIHRFKIDYDNGRTEELRSYGITVIRFSNDEVLNQIEIVEMKINAIIEQLKSKAGLNKS